MPTQLVDGLFADLLQVVRFLRVYLFAANFFASQFFRQPILTNHVAGFLFLFRVASFNLSRDIFPLRRHYKIIRVHSAFLLVASCVLLKYTRTDDVTDGVI